VNSGWRRYSHKSVVKLLVAFWDTKDILQSQDTSVQQKGHRLDCLGLILSRGKKFSLFHSIQNGVPEAPSLGIK
jgi:hypothetical protein